MESERNPQHILASDQNTELRKIKDVKLSTQLTTWSKHVGDCEIKYAADHLEQAW